MKRPKYFNHPVDTKYGHFDSKGEAERYEFLLEQEKQGLIRNLRKQVPFELIPRQTKLEVKHLKTKDKLVEKFLEHPLVYIADFTYDKFEELYGYLDFERKDYGKVGSHWKMIVEDFKGSKYTMTESFNLRKKLLLFRYGIQLKVVFKPNEPI